MNEPKTAAGPPDEILRVEDLHCGYGARAVLHGITLGFARGTFTGLIGPNGAGKTTFLRAVTGALAPAQGRILLAGRPRALVPPVEAARLMALTPQLLEVPFSFRVEDFVSLGRLPHVGRFSPLGARDRDAVRRALALVDLLDFHDRPMDTLSGGERQRAVLAQALAQDPAVLLLDEPGAYLDVNHQVEVFELLRRIRSSGLAVVVVLHDLNLCAEYCDRVVLLRQGAVEADGGPGDVLTPERLHAAFGIRLEVEPDPHTRRPTVRYRRAPDPDRKGEGRRVHVLCGGGSGAFLLRRLHLDGFRVTAGVLNEGDTDLAYARTLGIPAAEEAPFSPVGDEAAAAARAMMEEADVLVLAAVPFGRGNLKNLEVLPRAKAAQVFAVQPDGSWDFTGGRAGEILEELRAAGARIFEDDHALLEALRGG